MRKSPEKVLATLASLSKLIPADNATLFRLIAASLAFGVLYTLLS